MNRGASIFDLPMYLPSPTAERRRLIELQAREKIVRDVARAGYEVLEGSIEATWTSPFQGSVRAIGVKANALAFGGSS